MDLELEVDVSMEIWIEPEIHLHLAHRTTVDGCGSQFRQFTKPQDERTSSLHGIHPKCRAMIISTLNGQSGPYEEGYRSQELTI